MFQKTRDSFRQATALRSSRHSPQPRGYLNCFLLILPAIVIILAPAVLAQTVKFASPVTYPAGSPFRIAAGDFNGDGKIDLIAGDVENNNLVVLLGNGDGTLKPAVTYHLSAAPYQLAPADFNRDGRLDLAISNTSSATSISILMGKGDGSFEPPVTYNVAGSRLVVADLNRDGWPDLLARAGIVSNSNLVVLLNKGNGTFQDPKTYPLPQNSSIFAVKDINGDGRLDVITEGKTGVYNEIMNINVLLGKGDGTFQSPITSSATIAQGSGPYCMAVEDLDRDGKLDLVFTDEFLTVWKGKGDGAFVALTSQTRLSNTSADLKVADFNGDGRLDLVSSGVFSTGALQVLLGNGDGTFKDTGNLISGKTSVSVIAADLNGDTRPDLAAEIDGKLAVALLNVTPGNLDNPDYFVHQHYLDFLDREPDGGGFNYWTNEITSCGANTSCIDTKRTNVSAAFILSTEFQQTGYLIERMYKAAFGDLAAASNYESPHMLAAPIMQLNEYLMDVQELGRGVVVGEADWQTILDSNKAAFAVQFVQRPRFANAYPTSLAPSEFVDKLNQNAGGPLSSSERAAALAMFGNAGDTNNTIARAGVVRQIAENQNLYKTEFNRAFVLMEYFGYLRRNPNEGPDSDYTGYDFWLRKLNQFNGDYQKAEMVKALINSSEYRNRFGP